MTTTEQVPPRLKIRYREEIAGALREEFNFANVMQIPRVVKIVVNMGVGEAARDSKLIDGAVRDLATITGQKPQVRRAKKSIAQFKLREGMPIGAKVTQSARGSQQGGIVTQEAPIHVSNVQVVCPSCGKPSRIGHRRSEPDANGKTHSIRVCKRCNGDI